MTPRAWAGGEEWSRLGWAPDGMVRGAYWVEVHGDEVVVVGICDVDGDGEVAEYRAGTSGPAVIVDPRRC